MSTTLILPPAAVLNQAAQEMTDAAANVGRVKAIRKARYTLGCGVNIVPTATGFLLPSGSTAGTVHEVSYLGECSCPATHGCYHLAMIEMIELAQRYTYTPITQTVDYETALKEIEELYG